MSNIILLGKKIGMTQVFDENNRLIPVTVVEAGPCPVTKICTPERDGYKAVQIGFGAQKPQRMTRAELGHLSKNGIDPLTTLKEFRTEDTASFKEGDILSIERFELGQKVDVIAITKGRGFQGVVKRHGFSGGPSSHGSMFHRRGGSYGQCQWPGEVHKGRKMPGHMGHKQRTTQNLLVVDIIKEKNIILLKGSFPGNKGSEVIVRTAKKVKKPQA